MARNPCLQGVCFLGRTTHRTTPVPTPTSMGSEKCPEGQILQVKPRGSLRLLTKTSSLRSTRPRATATFAVRTESDVSPTSSEMFFFLKPWLPLFGPCLDHRVLATRNQECHGSVTHREVSWIWTKSFFIPSPTSTPS